MNAKELIIEIGNCFPFVQKPSGLQLTSHKVNCLHCEYLRRDLQEYEGAELPFAALRYLNHELSCLSAKGWQWVVPSYIRHCITVESTYDDMETEFLIYNLGPSLEFQAETIKRFSLMSTPQVNCLVHFLEWCANHEYWKDYCPENIAEAISFMRTLRA